MVLEGNRYFHFFIVFVLGLCSYYGQIFNMHCLLECAHYSEALFSGLHRFEYMKDYFSNWYRHVKNVQCKMRNKNKYYFQALHAEAI